MCVCVCVCLSLCVCACAPVCVCVCMHGAHMPTSFVRLISVLCLIPPWHADVGNALEGCCRAHSPGIAGDRRLLRTAGGVRCARSVLEVRTVLLVAKMALQRIWHYETLAAHTGHWYFGDSKSSTILEHQFSYTSSGPVCSLFSVLYASMARSACWLASCSSP